MPWYLLALVATALVVAFFAVYAAWIEWSDRRYVMARRIAEMEQRQKEIARA